MPAASAAGNPAFIADPVTWSARLIADHPTWTNAVFASVQLFLAAMAHRPRRAVRGGPPARRDPARLLWLILWGSLAWFAVDPRQPRPQAMRTMIALASRLIPTEPLNLRILGVGGDRPESRCPPVRTATSTRQLMSG
jgi:hypothetical protein